MTERPPDTRGPAPKGGRDAINDWLLKLETGAPGAWRGLATPTAVAGLLFSALYVAAYFLLRQSDLVTLSDGEVVTQLDSRRPLSIAGMYLLPFAGIAFLYFAVFLRRMAGVTGRATSGILGSIHVLAAAIFVALLFTAAAASTSAAANLQFASIEVNPLFARQLPLFGTTLLLGFAMRMAAMFVFTSSSIGRGSGLLPDWFGYLGYAVGLLLLLAYSVSTWFALVFPLWVALLCVMILLRRASSPTPASQPEL